MSKGSAALLSNDYVRLLVGLVNHEMMIPDDIVLDGDDWDYYLPLIQEASTPKAAIARKSLVQNIVTHRRLIVPLPLYDMAGHNFVVRRTCWYLLEELGLIDEVFEPEDHDAALKTVGGEEKVVWLNRRGEGFARLQSYLDSFDMMESAFTHRLMETKAFWENQSSTTHTPLPVFFHDDANLAHAADPSAWSFYFLNMIAHRMEEEAGEGVARGYDQQILDREPLHDFAAFLLSDGWQASRAKWAARFEGYVREYPWLVNRARAWLRLNGNRNPIKLVDVPGFLRTDATMFDLYKRRMDQGEPIIYARNRHEPGIRVHSYYGVLDDVPQVDARRVKLQIGNASPQDVREISIKEACDLKVTPQFESLQLAFDEVHRQLNLARKDRFEAKLFRDALGEIEIVRQKCISVGLGSLFGRVSTYCSLPVGAIEACFSGPPLVGTALGVAGTAAQVAADGALAAGDKWIVKVIE